MPQYKTYKYGDKVYYRKPGVAGEFKQFSNPAELSDYSKKGLIDEKTNPREALSQDPASAIKKVTNQASNAGSGNSGGSANKEKNPYRYPTMTGLNNNNQYQTELVNYYNNLDKSAPNSQEQGQIYQDSLAMYQDQIDAINSLYNQLVSQEQVAGEGRMGQTRAIGAAAGLSGTPRGVAQMNSQETANQKVVQGIRAEQGALISEILTKAKTRADDKIKDEVDLARTNAKDYLTYLKGQQDEARTDATTLAQAGIPLSELTDEEYKTLLESTGYDPLLFESIYNQNMPENAPVKYNYKQFGDTVVRVGDDGSFMEIGDYSELKDKQIKQLNDGTLIVFDPASGQYSDYGKYNEPPEVKGTKKSGFYYVEYGEDGKPQIKWLTRGTGDGSEDKNKILDYAEAIQQINAYDEMSGEEMQQFSSLNRQSPANVMTPEARKAAIQNIKAQAADELKSSDYKLFVEIIDNKEAERTYKYVPTEKGVYDVDNQRYLSEDETNNYADSVLATNP